MKHRYWLLFALVCLISSPLFSQNTFQNAWQNQTWGGGALFPSSSVWNMVGPYDFDQDGLGDFVASSSWSGTFLNGVYHYEASAAGDSVDLWWWYHFAEQDTAADNFSAVTVGDLDGDNLMEIIALNDCFPGQNGLWIFEWDPDSNAFPIVPTATWDLGLSNGIFEAGQINVANLDGDANQELIVSVMDGPWGTDGTSHLMVIELQNQNFQLPAWNVEMHDTTTSGWSGYTIYTTDLDDDGLQEIHTVGWLFFDYIIYENTGNDDEYALQNQFFVTLADEFSNQGLVAANFDNDDNNEMYLTTSGGLFYAVQESGDVSTINFTDNFHFFGFYEGGLRQIRQGDLDNDQKPDLYMAGNYNEAVYDWEYQGGSAIDPASFISYTIFQDDTTDDVTPGFDQGKFRASKLVIGDLDNDGNGDMVVSSASLAADKPTLIMLENGPSVSIDDQPGHRLDKFDLAQNYPNPFNPETQIRYTIENAGHVKLSVYNVLGQEILTIRDQYQVPGNYNVQWTGVDNNGAKVPSGVYFYRLEANGKKMSKKMVLSR